jgi:hypothetical protein
MSFQLIKHSPPCLFRLKRTHVVIPRAYKQKKNTENNLEKIAYYTEISKNVLSITTSIVVLSVVLVSVEKLFNTTNDIETKQINSVKQIKHVKEHQKEQDIMIELMFNEIAHFKEVGIV